MIIRILDNSKIKPYDCDNCNFKIWEYDEPICRLKRTLLNAKIDVPECPLDIREELDDE